MSEPSSPVKVSVVVPVYNPGPYLRDCVSSLLRQTLPAEEFEAIFVDDGSTDDTPAWLDQLAEEHEHFRVIHIPNSGWPGKPRNVGVDAAHGEYIQYVDQDDFLADDALRRLYELGSRNGSDIVIGKVVSNWRGVPSSLWKTTKESCTIHDTPLWDSLTPHKMFRRDFLHEHQIRFPEGKRRLEDQVYMMAAYFPAKVVSILGDYTCYYYWRRTDKANAGSTPIDPRGYYENLREVLDIVEHYTEPGQFRDTILRRFFRVEIMGRLNDRPLLRYEPEYREAMFNEIRKITLERIPPTVPEKMPALLRIRSALVQEDRLDDLIALARRCNNVQPRPEIQQSRWKNGVLDLNLTTKLWHGSDGDPLCLRTQGDQYFLDPELTSGLLDLDQGLSAVTNERKGVRTEVYLRERGTAQEWHLPVKARLRMLDPATGERMSATGSNEQRRAQVAIETDATLDPITAGGGEPLERGTWELIVRVVAFGLDRRVRLGAYLADGIEAHLRPAIVGTPALVAIPFITVKGHLALDVNRRRRTLADALGDSSAQPLAANGRRMELALPIASRRDTADLSAPAAVRRERTPGIVEEHRLAGVLRSAGDGCRLIIDTSGSAPGTQRVPAGRWHLVAQLDRDTAAVEQGTAPHDTATTGADDASTTEEPGAATPSAAEFALGEVDVDRRGRMRLRGAPYTGPLRQLSQRARQAASRHGSLHRAARGVARRLPAGVRNRARSVAARARR